MEVRGIEVTNQLRSAIRAKLLELGVRYDEELPDYILVMVVNKKTRQQMHEDLHLFLEDSTGPFVEWLHDQVLRKLQKVTIAKKKTTTSREFVPTVVVKQEEERRKRRNNTASEDSPQGEETAVLPMKEEKSVEKSVGKSAGKSVEKSVGKPIDPSEKSVGKSVDGSEKSVGKSVDGSEKSVGKSVDPNDKSVVKSIDSGDKSSRDENHKEAEASQEIGENRSRRVADVEENAMSKKPRETSKSRKEEEEEEEEKEESRESIEDNQEPEEEGKSERRLKSCVNRPKITSVVSVKTRLGIVSPRKKFDTHRADRFADSTRHTGNARRIDFPRNSSRPEEGSTRDQEYPRSARGNARAFFEDEKRARLDKPSIANVKDRLGAISASKLNTSTTTTMTTTTTPSLRRAAGQTSNEKDPRNAIKSRLGPLRNRHRRPITNERADFFAIAPKNLDDLEDEDEAFTAGPVRSRIIAVNRPEIVTEKRESNTAPRIDNKNNRDRHADTDNDDHEDDAIAKNIAELKELEAAAAKTIASKVIVTPRPLKPLQPVQKRATQSLLLRAVAEANRSVVKQKNPEPVLTEKKPRLKRPRPSGNREIGKNLSVHLNATKRLVMEKIQVQLSTNEDPEDNSESKQYDSHPVNEEHMGVVMSLFQRSDDNQKFLVTLNGYNNNVIKEKSAVDAEDEVGEEEEDERLEMEVTEDEELLMSSSARNEDAPSPIPSPATINETSPEDIGPEVSDKIIIMDENNENRNTENVESRDSLLLLSLSSSSSSPERKKRRKLSPIVYTRSRSRSPVVVAQERLTATIRPITYGSGNDSYEKRTIVDSSQSIVATDKSREKCRYWPNCTLGPKCAYYHPGVPCSAFPACKYGDKCAYKHPKCKFGLACTKLGCAFSHPKQQCKYHPFCTKPACPYSHPVVVTPGDPTRAKFTWKRRD